jgi:hypothetical protein
MNNNRNSDKTQPPTKLKLENTMDTSGRWFAVAVLFAVLVAGIIIYRAVNDDIRTASNDIPPHQLQVRDSYRTVPTR